MTFRRMVRRVRAIAANALASLAGVSAAYPSLDSARKEIFNSLARPWNGTADQVISRNLTYLVAQCRQIERFTCVGRGIVEGLVADIVGSGIDVMPMGASDGINLDLLNAWHDWAETALVDGRSLWEWQQAVVRDIATSGAALGRIVVLPERAAEGRIPVAILPLEVEWLQEFPVGPVAAENRFVRGIEVDELGRAKRYHFKNPDVSDSSSAGEVVSADKVIHIFEHRRAQQTHGEPALIPAIERLIQDGRLIETELKSSIATAAPAIVITSASSAYRSDEDEDGESINDIPAGATARLQPGETASAMVNPRPTQGIAPFRSTIRGDLAAACRVSQYWLDRDASRANYSSMRMDQLLTKRVLSGLKLVVGRGTAGDIYQRIFPWLMLSVGRPLPATKAARARVMRYDLRPDQPEYVDPVKDVMASQMAVANRLSSHDVELSSRGKDWQQIFSQAALEERLLDAAGVARIKALQDRVVALNKEYPDLDIKWYDVVALTAGQASKGQTPAVQLLKAEVAAEAASAGAFGATPEGGAAMAQPATRGADMDAAADRIAKVVSRAMEENSENTGKILSCFSARMPRPDTAEKVIERDAEGNVVRITGRAATGEYAGPVQIEKTVERDAHGNVLRIREEKVSRRATEQLVERDANGLVAKITVREA